MQAGYLSVDTQQRQRFWLALENGRCVGHTLKLEFLGRRRVTEPFFPSYLVRALTLTDLHTTDAVRKAVIQHGPQLGGFLRSYFQFAETTLGLSAASLESVPRGYALLFIAHLVIVRGAERSLSKVARLTRLYAELDYGGDEARAHQIASQELSLVS